MPTVASTEHFVLPRNAFVVFLLNRTLDDKRGLEGGATSNSTSDTLGVNDASTYYNVMLLSYNHLSILSSTCRLAIVSATFTSTYQVRLRIRVYHMFAALIEYLEENVESRLEQRVDEIAQGLFPAIHQNNERR